MRIANCFAAVFLFCLSLSAAVADRIAVVVDKAVITESEVLLEVRLTQFLNHQPLDLSAEQRRAAAERLVDQQLIRNEARIGNYPKPTAAEVDTIAGKFRDEHYSSPTQFQQDLEKYGITEEELREHLAWQVAAIRFTDVRFQPGTAAPPEQAANRYQAGAEPASNGTPAAKTETVDQQMDAWLKETRGQTRIQFKKEAFQ
ncbi:MAG TPA: hypothetical protein VGH38_16155 [Bryobacteraceae bacterium]|jgi:hypothetical protein